VSRSCLLRYLCVLPWDSIRRSRFCGWQTQPSRLLSETLSMPPCRDIAGNPCNRNVQAAPSPACTRWVKSSTSIRLRSARSSLGARRQCQLPASIAVQWARQVSDDFQRTKTRHRAHLQPSRSERHERPGSPCAHRLVHRPLDLDTMRTASLASSPHDFSAFRAAECQAISPVKDLRRARFGASGASWCSSLRLMLFCITWCATCGLPGQNRRRYAPTQWLKEVLESRDRARAGAYIPSRMDSTSQQ